MGAKSQNTDRVYSTLKNMPVRSKCFQESTVATLRFNDRTRQDRNHSEIQLDDVIHDLLHLQLQFTGRTNSRVR